MKNIIATMLVAFALQAVAQIPNNRFNDGLKLYISKDSVSWLKSTIALQTWARYVDNNPGTTINGFAQAHTNDIGIRRFRMQLFGQVTNKVFLYTQFGINNFNSLSTRKQGAFFHDLAGEYGVVKTKLSIGGGLSGWSGLSRYASPSIATTLLYDVLLYQQATNDVSDQFLRKLSVYAKGKLGNLDYRVAVAKPLPVQTAISQVDTTLGVNATFAPDPPKLQYQGYFNWQFFDKESNLTPYFTGTYLGKKRVLNVGVGAVYQAEAMRYTDAGAKLFAPMTLLSADVYYDSYLNKEKQTAITAYVSYSNYNFGHNYLRTSSVMNVANGSTDAGVKKATGVGNAFAMYGTGNVLYAQVGYLLKKNLLGKLGTLQPVADVTMANYKALNSPMILYDAGINLLLNGHNAKLSLNYQSRPVFTYDAASNSSNEIKSARRGMFVIQYQIFI
jgi:hypothetical protein